MTWFKFALSTAVTIALVVALSSPIPTGKVALPPVGDFFSPWQGFWQNGDDSGSRGEETLHLTGLQEEVKVVWDDREIPHIFAQNNDDLYYVQGYLTARHRLWQMDFLTYVAAGRLSEILGPVALKHDLIQRQTGMHYAAHQAMRKIGGRFPEAKKVIQAYTAGVNAYIQSLRPKDYPFEYKFFRYAPEPWTVEKSAMVLKYMSWTLTFSSRNRREIDLTRIQHKFGPAVLEQIFPVPPGHKYPVIPKGTKWPFSPIKSPKAPEKRFQSTLTEVDLPGYVDSPDVVGSNNWAVSGKKTASGQPILAGDPHLPLSLPSIWYECQLSAPGIDCYGVTIPGSPGIIIGFNRHIAWGVTNCHTDVADWYDVKFKDGNWNEYFHDKQWKKTRRHREVVEVRGGRDREFDLVFTHHGPVVYRPEGEENPTRGLALRWTGHDPSYELMTFYFLNRGKNYGDYLKALKLYQCPGQNFAYADVHGTIALRHNGKFPLRWKGQGMTISDGTDPRYDWVGYIPMDHVPQVKNPSHGFVMSANQAPVDKTYPYFLGFIWHPVRSIRIHQRLSEMEKITPRDMMKLQVDDRNMVADQILSHLVKHFDPSSLTAGEKETWEILKKWNLHNDPQLMGPTIFDRWITYLFAAIWRDEWGNGRLPSRYFTMRLIRENPQSRWFDDQATSETESLGDLLIATFGKVNSDLREKLGPPGEAWLWGNFHGSFTRRGLRIGHMARLPGLGRERVFCGGHWNSVNATSSRFGPSWRMVVSLEKNKVKAWGIYPGGQSGHLGSSRYDHFVDDWSHGKMAELLFLKTADDKSPRIVGRWQLEGRGSR